MGGLGGSSAMGGMGVLGGMWRMGSHRASVPTPPHSSSSFYSSDEAFWAYNFSELIPDAIPSVVYPHGVPKPQLFALLLGIPMLNPKNTGFY